jgi:hypothetical protein
MKKPHETLLPVTGPGEEGMSRADFKKYLEADLLRRPPSRQPELRDNPMFDSPEDADEILAEAKGTQAHYSKLHANTPTGGTSTK